MCPAIRFGRFRRLEHQISWPYTGKIGIKTACRHGKSWVVLHSQTPFQTASNIFNAYFCSRSTIEDLVSLSVHQETFIAAIEEAQAQIVQRRRDYRIQGNLGDLMDYVMTTLEYVLNSAARVLGAQHGLDNNFALSAKLITLLENIEMFEWFKIFAEDLDEFYNGLSDWSEFESLFFTNRHLERWLLFFGIIVEEADNGQVYVHVPLDSDAEYLLSVTAEMTQNL